MPLGTGPLERPVIEKLIDYQEFCGVGGSAPGQEEAGAVDRTERARVLSAPSTCTVREPKTSEVTEMLDIV